MVQANAITREEFREAHEAVKADSTRLDRQMNGNGQPGIRRPRCGPWFGSYELLFCEQLTTDNCFPKENS
jgi:hypothetical protein